MTNAAVVPTVVPMTNQDIQNAARGVRALIESDMRSPDGKRVTFPFKVAYRLGRMSEELDRQSAVIERSKFAHLLNHMPKDVADAITAGNEHRSLTVFEQSRVESAAMAYYAEVVKGPVESQWVQPLKVSELGVSASVLVNVSTWVRDLGSLVINDIPSE